MPAVENENKIPNYGSTPSSFLALLMQEPQQEQRNSARVW